MKRRQLDRKAAQLRGLAVFRDCTDGELIAASRLGDLATIPAGTVLVREGRPGTQFLVVVDGEAAVSRAGEQIAALRRGSFFGEVSLLTGQPRNATVTAATTLTVLAFDPRAFAELLRAVPSARDRIAVAATQRTAVLQRGAGVPLLRSA